MGHISINQPIALTILSLEEDIIRACVRGQRYAQEWIYNEYKGYLMGICRRYCSSREQAQDVLQDSFIKIFLSINTYSGKGSFQGWLSRIVINTAIKQNNKWDYRRESNDVEIYDLPVSESAALEKLSLQELLMLIEKLPKGCRTIFNLYVIDGFSHEEIAELINISTGTSKSQLSRAKKLLIEKISQISLIEEKQSK